MLTVASDAKWIANPITAIHQRAGEQRQDESIHGSPCRCRFPFGAAILPPIRAAGKQQARAMMPVMAHRIELFHFRYRDPRTDKWVRARYVARQEDIAMRHAEWQIVGPADVTDGAPEPPTRRANSDAGDFATSWLHSTAIGNPLVVNVR
jgi:hypothetical protein